jgi:RNA polymerase sigma-70 factor (ECF subfamily)
LAAEVPDPAADALAAVARRQEDELLAAAVAALPDRQRAALVLTYYEGLGAAQAATTLDTSVGAIEGLLVRARRFLRDRLRTGE